MSNQTPITDLVRKIFQDKASKGSAQDLADVLAAIETPTAGISEFFIGIKGDQGIQGQIGPIGPTGETGPVGPMGPQGIPGKDGKNGKDGVKGEQGPPGVNGLDGTEWHTDKGKPEEAVGKLGDFYLDSKSGDYYQKVSGKWGAERWIEKGCLKGPEGPAGPKGVRGSVGMGGIGGSRGGAALTNTDDLDEGAANLYYTAARVYAKAKLIIQAGANTTITPNDGAETLTIASTGGSATETIPPQMFWAGVY